jgi:acyl-homoserine-lactone acylase
VFIVNCLARYLWDNIIDGSTSATLWEDYFDLDQLPQVENPSSGFIQNCNSAPWNTTSLWTGENPVKSDYPFSLGIESRMTNRALRFLELLNDTQKLTWEDFLRVKYDMQYSRNSIIVQHIRRLLDELEFDSSVQDDLELSYAYKVLSEWDYSTDPLNRGAALAVLTISPFVQLHSFDQDPINQISDHFYVVVNSFKKAAEALKFYHRHVDVEWQSVNRIVRGEIDAGLGGGPDVPHTGKISFRSEFGNF